MGIGRFGDSGTNYGGLIQDQRGFGETIADWQRDLSASDAPGLLRDK